MCKKGGPRCSDKNKTTSQMLPIWEKRKEKATKQIESAKTTSEADYWRTRRAIAAKGLNGNKTTTNTTMGVSDVATPDGGGTISPTLDKIPATGFCYSPYPERSKMYNSAQEFAPDKNTMIRNLNHYATENQDLLAKDGHWVGYWHDPASGKIYLDISCTTQDAAFARKECEEKDQIAYFDLQDFSSVTVNPDATSGQK